MPVAAILLCGLAGGGQGVFRPQGPLIDVWFLPLRAQVITTSTPGLVGSVLEAPAHSSLQIADEGEAVSFVSPAEWKLTIGNTNNAACDNTVLAAVPPPAFDSE